MTPPWRPLVTFGFAAEKDFQAMVEKESRTTNLESRNRARLLFQAPVFMWLSPLRIERRSMNFMTLHSDMEDAITESRVSDCIMGRITMLHLFSIPTAIRSKPFVIARNEWTMTAISSDQVANPLCKKAWRTRSRSKLKNWRTCSPR
jgi:hypothetical protein